MPTSFVLLSKSLFFQYFSQSKNRGFIPINPEKWPYFAFKKPQKTSRNRNKTWQKYIKTEKKHYFLRIFQSWRNLGLAFIRNRLKIGSEKQ